VELLRILLFDLKYLDAGDICLRAVKYEAIVDKLARGLQEERNPPEQVIVPILRNLWNGLKRNLPIDIDRNQAASDLNFNIQTNPLSLSPESRKQLTEEQSRQRNLAREANRDDFTHPDTLRIYQEILSNLFKSVKEELQDKEYSEQAKKIINNFFINMDIIIRALAMLRFRKVLLTNEPYEAIESVKKARSTLSEICKDFPILQTANEITGFKPDESLRDENPYKDKNLQNFSLLVLKFAEQFSKLSKAKRSMIRRKVNKRPSNTKNQMLKDIMNITGEYCDRTDVVKECHKELLEECRDELEETNEEKITRRREESAENTDLSVS